MKELAQALVFSGLGFLAGWVLGCRMTRRTMEQAQRAIWKAASAANGGCWCATCDPFSLRMVVCPECGDKRCPRARDHRNECAARAAGRE